MADDIEITPGTGKTVATDEVTGSRHTQIIKIGLGLDGALDTLLDSGQQAMADSLPVVLASDHSDIPITLAGEAVVLGAGSAAIGKLAANSGVDIGDVDVLTVPADPFGVNADAAVAAGAAGSIQAKLRRVTQGLEDLKSLVVLAAGTNNIGDVDVLTVPSDPFGANADAAVAAGAAGSIQAKLRRLTQGVEDLKTSIVLAAGSAAIGKLAANSGVDIGDVDVTSVPADPFGANADAAVAAGAAGSIQAKLRRVTQGLEDLKTGIVLAAGSAAIGKLAANSGVDIGDVDIASIAAGDNNIGNVDVVTMPNVTLAAGTNTNEVVGDAAHDAGVAGNPLLQGGYASAAAPTSVDADGDVVRAWFLRNGARATVLTAAGALIGGDASNGLDVDVTRMAALVAGTAEIGFVKNSGTFATQIDGAALTALQLIDDAVFADEAAFTVASSKVHTIGLHCVVHGSAPDAAVVDTVVNPIANRDRVPFMIGGHPNVITLKHTTITTAVTDAAIITVSSGTKIVVTRITATLDNASTVFPTLLVGFGASTTPTTTGVLIAHGGVPAGGGMTVGDGSGILGVGGDGEDLRVTTTGNATGNGLQITVSYYTVPS